MRWRTAAVVSIGANLILAGVLLLPTEQRKPAPSVTETAGQTNTSKITTNVVIRRQFFTWHEVESNDYPTYIANLRDIGCPEQTIRDIIIADVNSLYARRRAAEVVTPDQQWWRSTPDPQVLERALKKSQELDQERRTLLSRLLGSNWEGGDLANLPRPSRAPVQLDGPVLGGLPAEINQAVQNITVRGQERVQAYLDAQQRAGTQPDPTQLARLQQETLNELASVLTPQQLEEYQLRYSSTAGNLRGLIGQMQYFEPGPEEFRNLFRAINPFDQQLSLLGSAEDPASQQQRRALLEQRENAIRTALGPTRYAEFRMLQDKAFREAVVLAQQANNPGAARTLYELSLAAQNEQERIRADETLTAEQKNIELKRIELEQLRANAVATGQELPPEPAAQNVVNQPQAPRRSYTVRRGDNLAAISMIHGVPPQLLQAANPNVNFNRLRGGEVLNIPPSLMPPMPP